MTQSTFLKSLAAFAAGLLALSCTKPMETVLSLSDLAANFEASGALEKTVSVTSNYDWTVSCPDAWVTVSPASGTGNGTFRITAAENKSFETRSSTVTVKANDKTATVKVSQLALTPSILVSPATLEVEAAGGAVSVDITSNAPWTITVPADGSWAAPDATSGEGSKKVTFTVAPNGNFEARSVDVTFSAQDKKATVKITQKAPDPTLEVNPFAVSAAAGGASFEIDVESNAPWTVTVAENWISVDPASGEGNAKVILTIAESEVRAVRSAVVTFKETVGHTEKTVNVSQEALPLGHKADSLALVAIYNAADGANWKEERRWDLTQPIDTWYGVKLTGGRVSQLAVIASGVISSSWTLPKEIGDLTELTVLKFNQCKLTGEIPEEVFTLSKLTDLYFQSNDLTGTFSDNYTRLTNLKNLYINNNKNLQGTLPASIGNLKDLESINIAQTKFSGTIPVELGQCTNLKNIMAWDNDLSGEIPDFWDKLPNVGVVQFYGNPGITGPIPPTMGTLKKATGIQLKDCNLTGNIPASFGGLEKCINLQLSGNKLSGVVPEEVQKHPKFLPDTGWKYETNILPQQPGYGLTLHSGSGGQDLDNPVDTDPWN